MNRSALKTLSLCVLATLSSASALTYTVVAGGQVSPDAAIVVGGKTYVPLSALKLLGVSSSLKGTTLTLGGLTLGGPASPTGAATPGGTDQRASLEGCSGDTLFNGVWRLTVKAVRPLSRYSGQQPGYGVTVEWKNGTPRTIDALNTGVKTVTLVLEGGSTLEAENVQDLLFRKLPQAAGTTSELTFYAPSATPPVTLAAPSKLLVEIRAAGAAASGVAYSTPTPSFRVKLDCAK